LDQALWSLTFSKAEHILALFADSGGKTREIAVGSDETKALEAPAMQQIHGINHHCNVGGILPADGWEVLREDTKVGLHGSPAIHLSAAEIPVYAADRSLAQPGDFLEQLLGQFGRHILAIDQYGEAGAFRRFAHERSLQRLARALQVAPPHSSATVSLANRR
jgi:hypothetical protein